MNFKFLYFISLVITFLHLIIHQIKNLDINNPIQCLKKFKSNNYLGIIVFFNILIGKMF
jgi:4-hydroxybenzoate polyprenyltransferase